MLCFSASFCMDFCPLGVAISVSKSYNQMPCIDISKMSPSQHQRDLVHRVSCLQSTVVISGDKEGEKDEQWQRIKWVDIGPDITVSEKQAISELSPKMTKRCKALMRRIICSHQDGGFPFVLAAWVKVMKPKRADWLSILKEMKRLDNPLYLEVMEYALVEESYEANVRDYTKIIDAYAKQNRMLDAENAFLRMKERGFTCDQVTLTVLVHMYSKAGDLQQAEETFQEIKLLGLPVDKRSYGSMIMAYIRAGMPELGERIMAEMDSHEVFAGKEVYKALLRAYSTIGNADGAQRVFGYMQLAGIVPDVKMCALLVNAYYVAGQSNEARCVLENMRSAGLKPSDKCVALMLASYEKENKLDKALALLMDIEKNDVVLGKEASEVLARWFHRLGVVNEVEHVLSEFAEKEVKCKSP